MRPMLVTVAVVATGNALTYLLGEGGWPRIVANWTFVLAVLGVGRALGLRRVDLGLTASGARNGWRIGAGAGLALGGAFAVLILVAPLVTGESARYADTEEHTLAELPLQLGVVFLVQTAIPEELLFRGVLYGLWQRTASTRAAIGANAVAFSLWHGVIAFDTVRGLELDVPLPLEALLYAGFLLVLGAAGAILAVLRWRTAGVVAPILAHWLTVVPARIAIWLQ